MSVTVPERVLVVGSGSIAQRHVRNLLAMGVREVVVVTARDASAVDVFADSRVFVEPEIPADCPPTAVIANDTDRHVATARGLVARGVHVLVEKPVAARRDEALAALLSETDASGVVGLVAYNMRFVGAIRELKTALESGAIGRPLFARIEVGQWLPDWRPNRPVTEGYSASTARGGGVALDLSHEIDYMTMLFGIPRSWQVLSSATGVLGIDAPDIFEGVYRYADGFTCSVHMDYLEREPRRRLRVVGEHGVAECDIVGGSLRIGGAQRSESALFDTQATYTAELQDFFAAVGGTGGGVLPTLAEAAGVLALLEPVREGECA